MKTDPIIYCRGRFLRQSEAVIPATDHGFLYGLGLFETFRTYGGRPFLLDRHMARLRRGMAFFRIKETQARLLGEASSKEDPLPSILAELLKRNEWEDGVFRLTLSAGPGGAGPPTGPYDQPTEIVFVRPLPPAPPAEGVAARLLETPRLPGEFFPRGKTAGYANSLAGWFELLESGADEAEGLFQTSGGLLSEGIFSNLFWVAEGCLLTPAAGSHALPGVCRSLILDLATARGYPVKEGDFPPRLLAMARAVFLTNSVRGILPVCQIRDAGGKLFWQGNSSRHPWITNLEADLREMAHC